MRPYLLFASVGDRSKHATHWLDDGDARTFDVVLCYYGDKPGRFRGDGDRCLERKGSKLGNAAACADEGWAAYRYILLLDDDIEIGTRDLDRLFALCDEHGVDLAQPAFTAGSRVSHAFTRARAGSTLRTVPFVEVGVAMFSARAFAQCRRTFTETVSGFGQDFVWPLLVPDPARIVVVDAVTCVHPARDPGDATGIDSLIPRRRHREEARAMLRRYGASNPMGLLARVGRRWAAWTGSSRGS